jgi:hypothetical protein
LDTESHPYPTFYVRGTYLDCSTHGGAF